ncbi:ATP-dependent RNA helicase (Hrh1) [Rasamsonia emersonii CBS 393.64]|uniref:RNA helicase n=1 Tax=Rasamsonia emersonii (strain ATCC 16479 / CBS 393.64 / IMI 116815) TaxID=1408163 RepID=A0A0F4Z5R6_RASE3|nr:ATP-dependent RNA helicase (Hrh1) [Rasamsonia emersonii CBS 393.64]KKA25208.1 ATP-dependent RNA helicase (Hrh1) [Rasamsonia emersonii CBS 393.64]
MPERVHTRFDDDSDDQSQSVAKKPEEAEKQKPATSQTNNEERQKSKKRKKEAFQGEQSGREQKRQTPDASANGDHPKGNNNSQSAKKHDKPSQQSKQNSSHYPSLKEKAKALYEIRKKLPIFPHAEEIRQRLRTSNVMLLVGETGSGKSTQIPQFLVDEAWCRPKNVKIKQEDGTKKDATVGGCIAITQPRRVAAISLARRVAEEMGTPLGNSSPASKVGYSVRFDTSTSPSTRIKYLTEGMLLQEMLHDPWLTKYSAVVVDEVHERGVNVDLVLGFLKKILSSKGEGRGGVPLKVVVMSATADMESLLEFFNGDSAKSSNDSNKDSSDAANGATDSKKSENQISVCHIKGRQYPVKVIYSPQPVNDFVDAALKVIFQIHYKEPLPGDILVFLTGQETVENLEYLVNEYAIGMDPALPKVLVLPLFAALPQAAQQRVFVPTPPRTRKVILATNIAETSVTVPGVRYVVDCGKAKMKQFRTRLGLDSLLVKPISKSAAIQRKGRAGREAPGQCYRLYTEKDYLALDDANTPEILRCDLSQSILTMKARGVDDIMNFPFLTRPPREALEKALLQLLNIQALDETGKISELGLQIAKLPLTPPLGRVLLSAAEYGQSCLLDVIDIISCLSVENIFLNPTSEEKREEAENVRRDLFRREGDHLTMLATVQAYAAENVDRKAWAERHMVSHRAMQSVMDVRKQLIAQCKQAKLLDEKNNQSSNSNSNNNNNSNSSYSVAPILKSFLTGFSTNIARLVPDGSYRTIVGNQTVAIHPSSVLYGRKVEAIMYTEYVFTTRSYARGIYDFFKFF